jgi:hypothetical protein
MHFFRVLYYDILVLYLKLKRSQIGHCTKVTNNHLSSTLPLNFFKSVFHTIQVTTLFTKTGNVTSGNIAGDIFKTHKDNLPSLNPMQRRHPWASLYI